MGLLFCLGAGLCAVIYFFDTARARELAILHGRRACKTMHYQFLDGTSVRYKTRLTRSASGQLCLVRRYHFDFTDDGQYRYQGRITLVGHTLEVLELDEPETGLLAHKHSLILSASYSEDPDEIRPRVEKRTDYRH